MGFPNLFRSDSMTRENERTLSKNWTVARIEVLNVDMTLKPKYIKKCQTYFQIGLTLSKSITIRDITSHSRAPLETSVMSGEKSMSHQGPTLGKFLELGKNRRENGSSLSYIREKPQCVGKNQSS